MLFISTAKSFINKENNVGESTSLCFTPDVHSNHPDIHDPHLSARVLSNDAIVKVWVNLLKI